MDNVVTSGDVIEIKTTSDVFFEEAPYDYFTFDRRSRKITIPASFVTLGVESDDSSERVWFEGPRIVGDNVDLTTRNIYINYQNANGEKDKYYVEDIVAEDDIVHFSWKVERKVVAYKGNVTFLICALTTDEEGKVETEWHTSRCTALVLEGLEVENPAPPAEEYDLINQLIDVTKKSIKDVTDTCAQTIEELGTKEQEAINNIAEKETNSIDAVEKAKNDAVEYIGNGLDSTLTKQGIAAESQAVGDAILKARIVDRASGELISLADSAEQPLQSMKIYGKTEQFTTTGKNKLPYPYTNTTITLKGVTFTDNGDGTITCNGTAEETVFFRLRDLTDGFMVSAGEYTLSGCPSGGSNSTYHLYCVNKSQSAMLLNDAGNGATATLASDEIYGFYIKISNGQTVSNLTFKPMLRPVGTDATWEPYTGGIPSPNPNYPQELVSVGDSGSTTEYVMGGNLFNNDTSLLKEVTYTNSQGNRETRIGYEPLCLPAGTYTFTLTDLDTSVDKFIYGAINDKEDKYVTNCNLLQSTNNFTPLTITVNEGDKIFIYNGHAYLNMANRATEFKKVKIQLNAGSVAKPYEPYKSQSLTIQTPNGLPGLKLPNNVSSLNYDYSYVIDGTRFVCDEKDYKRFVYRNPIRTIVYTGDENWKTTVTTITNIYYLPLPAVSAYGISSHFQSITHSQYQNGEEGMHISNTATLYINASQFATLEEFKAFLKAQYEAGTPVTLVYAVKNAKDIIETPLTEEEIQAYKALHTNYPNTTIYNSDGAGAEVEYVADTKLYVDNKIDKAIKNILEVVSNDG